MTTWPRPERAHATAQGPWTCPEAEGDAELCGAESPRYLVLRQTCCGECRVPGVVDAHFRPPVAAPCACRWLSRAEPWRPGTGHGARPHVPQGRGAVRA